MRTKREIERNIREGTVIAALLKNDMAVKYYEDDGSVTVTRTRSGRGSLDTGNGLSKSSAKRGELIASGLTAGR